MGLVFWLTFGVIGAALQGLMEDGIAAIIASADASLKAFGTNDVVRSLAVDGVLTGVGSVLTFLPIIVVLFLFLSILEDSGYMARVALACRAAASCPCLSVLAAPCRLSCRPVRSHPSTTAR